MAVLLSLNAMDEAVNEKSIQTMAQLYEYNVYENLISFYGLGDKKKKKKKKTNKKKQNKKKEKILVYKMI
jgi:hypothetical protein